jgi:hypothetical protein
MGSNEDKNTDWQGDGRFADAMYRLAGLREVGLTELNFEINLLTIPETGSHTITILACGMYLTTVHQLFQ